MKLNISLLSAGLILLTANQAFAQITPPSTPPQAPASHKITTDSVEFRMTEKKDGPNLTSPQSGRVKLGDKQIYKGTYYHGHAAFIAFCNQFDKAATKEEAGVDCSEKPGAEIDKLPIDVQKNTDPTLKWKGTKLDACNCVELERL